jgi:hypothetical protein
VQALAQHGDRFTRRQDFVADHPTMLIELLPDLGEFDAPCRAAHQLQTD